MNPFALRTLFNPLKLRRSFSKVVDFTTTGEVRMLKHEILTKKAWTGKSIKATDILVSLEPSVQKELTEVVRYLRSNPFPTLCVSPTLFPFERLTACRTLAAKIRENLDNGLGLCILDRVDLDSDNFTAEDSRVIFWLLGQLIANPVAQSWEGSLLYDVQDTGKNPNTQGVRRSKTKADLCFHTDNSMGRIPPEYVSLFCIRPALSGGTNRFISLYSVHNLMLKKYPTLLQRLYLPYYFDRQGEHATDAPRVSRAPIFSYDGKRLAARLYPYIVHNGYKLLSSPMDVVGAEALQALEDVLADDSLWIEFELQRGQAKYLNNSEFAHLRTEFINGETIEQCRHLLRMWHRSTGAPFYDG